MIVNNWSDIQAGYLTQNIKLLLKTWPG